MAITVRFPGYVIEVQDESDLRVVMRVLGDKKPLPTTENGVKRSRRRPVKVSSDKQPGQPGDLTGFAKAINQPNQLGVLGLLAEHPRGMWANDIKAQLRLKSSLTLPGVLTAIYRNARHYDLRPEEIIIKRVAGSQPKQRFHYRLVPELFEAWGQAHPPDMFESGRSSNGSSRGRALVAKSTTPKR